MTHSPSTGSSTAELSPLSSALVDIAAEVEAAEHQIKQEILTAARAGDIARIVELVEGWLARPPVEVLSKALPSSGSRR